MNINFFSKKSTLQSLIQLFIITVLLLAPISATTLAAPLSVQNPSLEQLTNLTPDCFSQSGWGGNTAAWAISKDAHSGINSQSVSVTNYASGDRKLIMSENATCAPSVTVGTTYQLSVWYKSTSSKNSLTVFKHSAAGWTYWTDITPLPATTVWSKANGTTPVIPAGTDQISFGISISANGTLLTDDYEMVQTGSTPPVSNPELTANPGLENGANPPTGWFLAGWGDGTVTGSVTPAADAHSGQRAYSISLANRTQGDYKLLPAETSSPAVQPGSIYKLSAWYKSTSVNNSLTVFSHTAAGWGYWTDLQSLPASPNWVQTAAQTPAIPAGVDAIAWGITIYGNGTLVTDDYSTTKFSEATPPPVSGPAAVGQWTVSNYSIPIRAVHSTLLKNGKILLIAGSGNSTDNFTAGSFKASVWDPVANTFNILNVPKDMFCSGHVTLPDGKILIQGGTKSYPSTATGGDYGGLRDSWIFDPDTNIFTATNLANEGHWYPTLTELGSGDISLVGGLKEDTTGSVNTERFSYATGQWLPSNQIPQTYSFWGLYPHMFLLNDGRMFYSGGHVFGNGLPGSGASIYNVNAATIADIPGLRMKDMRDQSASVLLPPAQDQKVLITGGGNINTVNPGINLSDIIDLSVPSPAYVPAPTMPGEGKMYVNATTLPDRTVLTTNGGKLNRDDSTNVLTAASYDPFANKWTTLPADPIGRNYHSSAVLLADGRLAVIGSNPANGSFEMRISIYQPSYFFRTPRPTITNAPPTATYGQQFTFNVNSSNKTIKWAQLMRPMSITHQTDSNMRLVDVPVVIQNGVATATIPLNRNLLPPGPYMLTVTDSDNVPSVASWVNIK